MIIGKGCIKYIDLKFDEQDEFEANLESFGMKYKKDFIFIGSSRDNIVAKFFPQYINIVLGQVIRVFKCNDPDDTYLILTINEN